MKLLKEITPTKSQFEHETLTTIQRKLTKGLGKTKGTESKLQSMQVTTSETNTVSCTSDRIYRVGLNGTEQTWHLETVLLFYGML